MPCSTNLSSSKLTAKSKRKQVENPRMTTRSASRAAEAAKAVNISATCGASSNGETSPAESTADRIVPVTAACTVRLVRLDSSEIPFPDDICLDEVLSDISLSDSILSDISSLDKLPADESTADRIASDTDTCTVPLDSETPSSDDVLPESFLLDISLSDSILTDDSSLDKLLSGETTTDGVAAVTVSSTCLDSESLFHIDGSPKECFPDAEISHATDAVELQAEVGPDQNHSPTDSHSELNSSALSREKSKLNKVVLKDQINWPPASDESAWRKLDTAVLKQLPSSGSVDQRLKSLEEGIYLHGLHLFGSKVRTGSREKPKRKSVKATIQLVMEKNTLMNEMKVCDFSKREGLSALLEVARSKLRAQRKKERHSRRSWKARGLYKRFKKDPFAAGREILSPSPDTRLEVNQDVMDTHLENLCKDDERDVPLTHLEGLPNPPSVKKKFPIGSFFKSSFQTILKKKRNKSAPGINRIPYTVYKRCANLADYLFLILNSCNLKKYVPIEWRVAMEIYIPKVDKPGSDCIGDFRAIALTNVEGKLFWSLVSQELMLHLVRNNKLIDTSVQKGCMANTPGVWEHVSMVWSALQEARTSKGDIATVWLDIANAYGSIPHQLIFFALKRYGVSVHCISIVRQYYDALWSKSFLDTAPSNWHQHKRGIFAGCTLSISLFISGMNVILEYVNNCSIRNVMIGQTQLPRVRAFMDDLNLMSLSVEGTGVLLKRCCTALGWARMEFKASKSRYAVIKAGRALSPAISPFGIPVGNKSIGEGYVDHAESDATSNIVCIPNENLDRIPSIQGNPVRFLGRVISGCLTDRRNTDELKSKLADGLVLIDRCSLKGAQKLWICHHLLMPRIRWPLLIYEIPMTVAAVLEQKVSAYMRKWLGISRSITNVCLYSSGSPCPLPLQSVTSILKIAKVGGYQQLKYSSDPLVSGAMNDQKSHCDAGCGDVSSLTLRAGNWDAGKESRGAECDVRVKEILGVTRTSKAGLGYEKYQRVPSDKQSSHYRKLVTDAVKQQVENEYSAKAASEALQCQWTKWTNYIKQDLRWANILAMPPNLLSFCLNATFSTLPSPSNLRRMKIQTEASCSLCSHSPCTVPHVLSGCKWALNQERYDFRHDSVLKVIVLYLEEFLESVAKVKHATPTGIEFVPEGTVLKRNLQRKKGGMLRSARDWKMTADLGSQRGYAFPPYLAMTRDRPDILLESVSAKRVILIELTCPSEENFEGANQYKRTKYKSLMNQVEFNGWLVHYFPIEVGARGYCATNVRALLSTLGLSGRQGKQLIGAMSRTALEKSFTIWLSRDSKTWDVGGIEYIPRMTHTQPPVTPASPVPISDPKLGRHQAPILTRQTQVTGTQGKREALYSQAVGKKVTYATLLKSGGKRITPPPGIMNKGDTCYANSILQALSVFPEFHSLCPESNRFLKAFRSVMTQLITTSPKLVVDPLDFLKLLQTQMRTANPDTEFCWNTQNDAPEVLEVLIEAVTSECAAAKDLFGVVERQSQTCSVCSHVSSRAFPPQNLLYVNVKESVEEMIESSSVDEAVVRECAQCGEKQMMSSRTDLAVAPPILILQIRDRFLPSPLNDGSNVRNSRVIKHLSSPNVRIRTGVGVEICVRYDVLAIIHHEGIRNNRGHYFAHIKRQDSWFRCSDRAVTPSVLSTLGADTAYVVLCKKVR